MRKCWSLNPDERPSFHELVTQWEKMLSDQVEYLDLTNNAIHNRSYFCSPVEETEGLLIIAFQVPNKGFIFLL